MAKSRKNMARDAILACAKTTEGMEYQVDESGLVTITIPKDIDLDDEATMAIDTLKSDSECQIQRRGNNIVITFFVEKKWTPKEE